MDEDKVPFQAWRSKASEILDADDCLDLCDGTEVAPTVVGQRFDAHGDLDNEDEMDEYFRETKSFNKRKKKASILPYLWSVIASLRV